MHEAAGILANNWHISSASLNTKDKLREQCYVETYKDETPGDLCFPLVKHLSEHLRIAEAKCCKKNPLPFPL
jgi:hypothetical protein